MITTDRSKIDVYLGSDYLNKISFVKKALPMPTTNLIVWLLFRGFLDYHKKKAAFTELLKKYRYMKKTKDSQKVQVYISFKLENGLFEIYKNQLKMKRQEFLNKTVKMELDKFSECLYQDAEEVKEIEKKRGKALYISINEYLYKRLEKISGLTGIRLSSLIPLMLFEYLNILDEGRYK